MRRLFAISVLVLASCSSGPPQRAADVTGFITTATETNTWVLVEASPRLQAGDKAVVTLVAKTRIWSIKGTSAIRADAKALAIGSKVRVWFDGPVLATYPAQGTAGDIAIDVP